MAGRCRKESENIPGVEISLPYDHAGDTGRLESVGSVTAAIGRAIKNRIDMQACAKMIWQSTSDKGY
jgi:hypothetical protein